MLFSSVEFLFRFLPVFMLIYLFVPEKYRNIVLLSGSLLFYAAGEPYYVLLLILSILVNYGTGKLIQEKEKKVSKNILILSLIYNFGMLFVFKYWDFAAGLVNQLFAGEKIPLLSLSLPLGISFYTFQIVSYLFDCYRGKLKEKADFVSFAAYVAMFPQLVAGPIVKYEEVAERMKTRKIKEKSVESGLKLFSIGLGFKVLLANQIGTLWNTLMSAGPGNLSAAAAWMGAFAYSFQIYFDFWGYSLMASGLMVMLGFEFIPNFNHPYAAKSISEFYRRWHVTLGSWFRDYVYIPLGGSRCSKFRLAVNLAVVWLLTGIWHGNGLNYLIWGAVLGLFVILEKLVYGKYLKKVPVAGNLYVLLLIPLTWVTFAVTDLKKLGIYFGRLFPMIGGAGIAVNQQDIFRYAENYGIYFIAGIALCIPAVYELFEKHKRNPVVILLLAAVFWASVYLLCSSAGNPFMYLKF